MLQSPRILTGIHSFSHFVFYLHSDYLNNVTTDMKAIFVMIVMMMMMLIAILLLFLDDDDDDDDDGTYHTRGSCLHRSLLRSVQR